MASPLSKRLHVAIVGGGLCGLALAIALTKRGVSYTIYETRASFTEIGAGINLAPNSLEAFNLIDPSLGEVIFRLATRNPPGREYVWLSVRLGAPTHHFEDAKLVVDIEAPPTGNTTVSRNELLQEMAKRIEPENAKFNKKLTALEQTADSVVMCFEDGSKESASLVVACDGAHSAMRRLILGLDNPASYAQYSQMGVYRAMFSMSKLEEAIGVETAHCSHIWAGPRGYIIEYPVNGGQDVNVGFWPWKKGDWNHKAWVLDNQRPQLMNDWKDWGPAVQKMLALTGEDTQFWATHHHSLKPKSYFDGRAIVIGDAAHSMGPHKGQGAAQSMEDAYVMAEVLEDASVRCAHKGFADNRSIEAAFIGYETVRRTRFERVLDSSYDAMSFWSDFWRPDLTEADLERFKHDAYGHMRWIWDAQLGRQGKNARQTAVDTLDKKPSDPSSI